MNRTAGEQASRLPGKRTAAGLLQKRLLAFVGIFRHAQEFMLVDLSVPIGVKSRDSGFSRQEVCRGGRPAVAMAAVLVAQDGACGFSGWPLLSSGL